MVTQILTRSIPIDSKKIVEGVLLKNFFTINSLGEIRKAGKCFPA